MIHPHDCKHETIDKKVYVDFTIYECASCGILKDIRQTKPEDLKVIGEASET